MKRYEIKIIDEWGGASWQEAFDTWEKAVDEFFNGVYAGYFYLDEPCCGHSALTADGVRVWRIDNTRGIVIFDDSNATKEDLLESPLDWWEAEWDEPDTDSFDDDEEVK